MTTLALLCGLLVSTSTTDGPGDDRGLYDQLRQETPRDAESQVGLALWCEEHGLAKERARHLAMAVLANPGHVLARSLMGLVKDGDGWRPASDVARREADDPAHAALLDEYHARRDALKDSADDHSKLAQWCDANGLHDEAQAHWRAVVRNDPARDNAWRRLGCKKINGRWLTDAQFAAEKAEAEAQKAADRDWSARLATLRNALKGRDPERRAEAERALADITDPRAVSAIYRAFFLGKDADPARGVQLLSQIDAPQASRALASVVALHDSDAARALASASLRFRDPREFAESLINLIREPIAYEVRPVEGPGSPGVLYMEGQQADLRRIYQAPLPNLQLRPTDQLNFDEFGMPVITRATGTSRQVAVLTSDGRLVRDTIRDTVSLSLAAVQREAMLAAASSNEQLNRDVAVLRASNDQIEAMNARIKPLLASFAGRDLGPKRDAWMEWAVDLQGYAYSRPLPPRKQVVTEYVTPQYVPTLVQQFEQSTTQTHGACFAAGTPVMTVDGPRPIESIHIGDRVLGQDPRTGALNYQPVVMAYHNPPHTTLKLAIGDQTIVATPIHRFWKAGKGWVMARELRTGDLVRTLEGTARVGTIEAGEVQPVFNLEVASGQSFFVGDQPVLVHDNTVVRPVARPFDAAPTASAKGR